MIPHVMVLNEILAHSDYGWYDEETKTGNKRIRVSDCDFDLTVKYVGDGKIHLYEVVKMEQK